MKRYLLRIQHAYGIFDHENPTARVLRVPAQCRGFPIGGVVPLQNKQSLIRSHRALRERASPARTN
jgi:hypothetical protein